MKRIRYQQGTLRLEERANGNRVWEYRWYETQIDGTRRRRSAMIGMIHEFPSESAAQKAVAALRANVNAENPRTQIDAISFDTLAQHYREKELCEESGKTFATIRTHEGYPERWILPRWSLYRLKDVKAVIVEEWLRSLPLANGSKAKIRNLMHSIFNHAMRWEWHDRNPITRVRQSRQTSKDSGRVGYRADQVSARTSKGAWQDSRASRHSHRAAGERTARAEMVGRGL